METVVTRCTPFLKFILFCTLISAVTVADYRVDDSGGLGRQFDGIGGLSGGGATSKLLVNYPEPQRSQILDYLFLPRFGASLQIFKVEICGDAPSGDGTESSHMHEPWDLNYQRGYEWWLMTEAKKRNPNIKLYGLPWAFPGWVGKGSGSPYKYPSLTAGYIINWLNGAKNVYQLHIDYIGIWNERQYDKTYIEALRSALDAAGYKDIKMVAADGGWDISKDILADVKLANAVDIIGAHYPGTYTSMEALQTGKQLWASEDYSTFNDNVGGGCWARLLNQNYVNGFMTSTISWNLIASYYEKLPYTRDGLMTAIEPWSGHYDVSAPIWISAHTTQFTQIGWKYLRHGVGVGHLQAGGSYVSLVSPDGKDFTMVIETMTHNHSICIRPALPPYQVQPQTASFRLKGSFKNITSLYAWYTRVAFNQTGNDASTFFKEVTPIKVIDGMFTIPLDLDEVITLTTISTGNKGNYPNVPPSRGFLLPYKDNFDGYKEFQEPFNLSPQVGVMEVRKSSTSSRGMIMRQVVQHQPVDWCANSWPMAVIGPGDSTLWQDIWVQIDVMVPSVNGSSGVFVGARVDRGGCDSHNAQGVFFLAYPSNKMGAFSIATDIAMKTILVTGEIEMKLDTWYQMTLAVQNNTALTYMNGELFLKVQLPSSAKTGFASVGTTSFGLADFDNLVLEQYD